MRLTFQIDQRLQFEFIYPISVNANNKWNETPISSPFCLEKCHRLGPARAW